MASLGAPLDCRSFFKIPSREDFAMAMIFFGANGAGSVDLTFQGWLFETVGG